MRYENKDRFAGFKRGLLLLLLLAGTLYIGYRFYLFYPDKAQIPAGSTMAGLDISLMSVEEAMAAVTERYAQPIAVQHQAGVVELTPESVGFKLDSAAMQLELEAYLNSRELWQSFVQDLLEDVWPMPVMPAKIELLATHDPALLEQMVASIGSYLDVPAQNPHIIPVSLQVAEGSDGYRTDVTASLEEVTAAFYSPTNRQATLKVTPEVAEAPSIELLKQYIETQIANFSGSGSFYLLDLQTGDEILVNADRAMSGTSTVKIAIILETYRAQESLDFDQRKLISETLTLSGNYSANLLLDVVAGQDNAYLGSDILTESLWNLGLVNTFIATPYEEPARSNRPTYITPANSIPYEDMTIDPAMQTTAEDIGTLLSMIYHCANGGGALLAMYPEQLTPQECQEEISYLTMNAEGNWLLRDGLPPDTVLAHKHGWIDGDVGYYGTHSDAGIIFSPGGDFVLVGYLYDEGWLDWLVTGPIMRNITRAAYNYFNPDAPFILDEATSGN
ncbi:MAG: serine hydrolase [Anaerolineales bacterium]|nr:serine hydrolase [Anaerolineales bacterium]MCB0005799.1 serine hydrolase [Anaerolineales bacterium]MCB0013822.1 serine hydrolase [Anaerolineales bacterium]